MAGPILSWGLENIDQEKVKNAISNDTSMVRGLVEEEAQAARDRAKNSTVVGPLVTGTAKAIGGGLAAPFSAVANTVANTPSAIASMTGTETINPSTYGMNPGLDMASQGVAEIKSGLTSGIGQLKQGVMSLFGLKEKTSPTPAANIVVGASPSVSSPVQSPSVAVPHPAAKPAGLGGARKAEQGPPVEAEPEPSRSFPEVRGVIRNDQTGKTIYIPETREQRENRVSVGGLVVPESQAGDVINQKIESLVSDLLAHRMTPGGLRVSNKKLEMVKDIRLGQLGVTKEIEKAKIAGEYGLAGHKLTADVNADIRRDTLEEKKRYNDILARDYSLRLQQQKDVADQNALQKILSQFAVQESDPMNPGEKSVNMRHTYFNIWDSGTTPHPAIADAVNQMGTAYQTYREQTMKLSGKKSLAPDEEKLVKARFRKSLSQYPQIAQ